MRSRSTPFALLVALAALSTAALVALPALAKAPARAAVAPALTLPTRNGTVSLDSLHGKVVLVDFWASWCAPCRQSFPWLKSLHDRYAAKGFEVVAVNLDKERAPAEDFLDQYPAPFVVAFDPAGKSADAFRVSAMPSSFLVGPTGTLLYSHAGFDPKKTRAVEALIEEALTR